MNPMAMVTKMLENSVLRSNPMIGNVINMQKAGNKIEVENFARNFCKSMGINFDEEFSKFMQEAPKMMENFK